VQKPPVLAAFASLFRRTSLKSQFAPIMDLTGAGKIWIVGNTRSGNAWTTI
jgi:hypothetical protein